MLKAAIKEQYGGSEPHSKVTELEFVKEEITALTSEDMDELSSFDKVQTLTLLKCGLKRIDTAAPGFNCYMLANIIFDSKYIFGSPSDIILHIDHRRRRL